ncbi:diflavin flavoprotein [Synechococcus sp. PCC 6717]|jgi:flavorubredoxin/flavin reductase (DIM6/NTAB) family NADH-FMN oxidoreductase RutF|uniref:Flavin oxidoreductase n=1 Tax=Parathermosynechococcus lividus PCC 6715 TaxID=1917166 RepID=A0A2D2Q334_PARLV|nr:diflavin flavoprotein [Thermostichus lividus]ATS18922.1 flavin oxidoreductase [Thermostichus lividus PCC 6715]MCH9056235.1 diflavin flavoprotein [Synechococcus sp. PCC 6716]MCI3280489.1 diflavin flavoprotein [Synechococcus sp. PCC 6717]
MLTETRPRDVQVAELVPRVLVLRSRTWERLKFEVEYGRQQGTTSNSYLLKAAQPTLLDPPGESFSQLYLKELAQQIDLRQLRYLILSHVNSNRLVTVKALLERAPQMTLVCSKAGAVTLRAALGDQLQLWIPRSDTPLDVGDGWQLEFIAAATPRWPDGLITVDRQHHIVFTDKLFGAHVCSDSLYDEQWKKLDEDRAYYFECLHAAQPRQVESILDRIAELTPPPHLYAPAHGPIVKFSRSRLFQDYRDWCHAQTEQETTVALFYASAYGNTAILANAIAQGLTAAGVQVAAINCETTPPAEMQALIHSSDGFIVGSPTLGGHMPTQVQTALGFILAEGNKTKLAGVFGSYGWSGEAIDDIEQKLLDAGYTLGFETLRVKFTPTAADLEKCQAAAQEFAQALKKLRKSRTVLQPSLVEAQVNRTAQAVNRVVGSLCILTTLPEGCTYMTQAAAILVSSVSQASFNPPGVTVSLPQQWADSLCLVGDRFVLNILKEGSPLVRQFQQAQRLGEQQLATLGLKSASSGAPILLDALAYIECTVESRMKCGDHWLIYAVVDSGELLQTTGLTAIQHRKTS